MSEAALFVIGSWGEIHSTRPFSRPNYWSLISHLTLTPLPTCISSVSHWPL